MRAALAVAMMVGLSAWTGAAAPAEEKRSLLSQILERCPVENRLGFLGSVRFIGDKVADLEHRSIAGCLGSTTLRELAMELAQAGDAASPVERRNESLEVRALFSACPAGTRRNFYERLQFRDGRLVGMFIGKIWKCGERDILRFLSLFGVKELGAAWKKDCYCKQPGVCFPKPGYVCNADGC